MLELLFLGTGAAVPSRERSTSCIAVKGGSDIILLDCGEGSQRQLMVSPFSFMRIRAILITHLHGDHVLGLPGLLQTMGLSGRKDPLTVYGPKGIRDCVMTVMALTEGETEYQLEFAEVVGGEEFKVGATTVRVFPTDHGIESVGYSIEEPVKPGKLDREKALRLGAEDGPDMAKLKGGESVKGIDPSEVVGPPIPGARIVYTGDTVPTQSTLETSMGATVLVHESTYMSTETALAEAHRHTTALQAAELAAEAGVGCLILTHISNRYDEPTLLEEEASKVFPNVHCASDMDHFLVAPGAVRKKESSQ